MKRTKVVKGSASGKEGVGSFKTETVNAYYGKLYHRTARYRHFSEIRFTV